MAVRTQLKTKLKLIKIEEAGEKALVYANFAEPDIHQNLLTDMILYSKKFTADMNVMLLHELGLPETELSFVEDQRKFLAQSPGLRDLSNVTSMAKIPSKWN